MGPVGDFLDSTWLEICHKIGGQSPDITPKGIVLHMENACYYRNDYILQMKRQEKSKSSP